jgi:hypothetical protein
MRLGLWIAAMLISACNGGHSHDLPPSCQELVDLCHDPGEAGDADAEACHEIGHDGDEAACDAEYDACITTCEGA